MASIPKNAIDYPTSDGRPMAETDFHRDLMVALIESLKEHYQGDPMTYVSGNLMLFYEEGNKRKHISPDVFVVHGVSNHRRNYYLAWEEGKSPDVVVEITSKSTKSEDVKKKLTLYRDVLAVPEYFLFDPFRDYLKPPMQGYRLLDGNYEAIAAVEGRLPSVVLGLHLERDGSELRLWDPSTGCRVLKPSESAEARMAAQRVQAEADRQRANQAEADLATQRAMAEVELARRLQSEADNEQLRRELEAFRGGEHGAG